MEQKSDIKAFGKSRSKLELGGIMYTVYDLYMLKSKNVDEQRDTIKSLTTVFFQKYPELINDLLSSTKNGLFSLADETPQKIIQYCLFAIYASDVATAMHPDSRRYYIENLRSLAEEYDLNYEKIVYLCQYESVIISCFKAKETNEH
jgi:hypothetical protein